MKNKEKLPRYLTKAIQKLALDRNKMAFISGPRQIGKTTETFLLKKDYQDSFYFNWDEQSFKKLWTKGPQLVLERFDLSKVDQTRLLILDEIHKSKNWKQKLKGLYDLHSDSIHIVVTGSARLNVYRKGSDSLMGRYLHFRLHPLSLRELTELEPQTSEECFKALLGDGQRPPRIKKNSFPILERLMQFSGFPEPYLNQNKNIHNIWKRGRNEKIVREDLRDLSQIREISQIEVLLSLLPDRVGSPLSIQSLREDLEVAHDTVTRWLEYLKELYYFFEIKPYSHSVPRSLKKEGKIYFFDWTENENPGGRFENLIASHLLKACHYWTDVGEGDFQLHYLRNKEKQEVDFLITCNKRPWLSVECKLSDTNLDRNYKKFQEVLKCPHIQVVFSPQIFRKVDPQTMIMGADFFLSQFV